ncbi:MAG: DUF2293 domain-containing protein [Verrucomicrobiales bacterium]
MPDIHTHSPRQSDSSSEQDIVVFSIRRDAVCSECKSELGKDSFLKKEGEKLLCLDCADMGHLVYLPRGDTALTRRSRKNSALSAVVVKFSRTRGRYERQGVLVEQSALERAEAECLGDEEARRLARERAAVQRERSDARYVGEFSKLILRCFPNCPPPEAETIAAHACQKYSGRVGRSAAAKNFDESMAEFAARAYVRHVHTGYDRLLSEGWERHEARAAIAPAVDTVIERWRAGASPNVEC